MFKQRVITGVVLLLLTCMVLFMTPAIVFASIVWMLCLGGVYELVKIYQFDLINQIGFMLILTFLAGIMYFSNYDISAIMRIISISVWCFIVPFILINHPRIISKPLVGVLAIVVFVPAFYAIVQLYDLLGPLLLLSILAIAWVSDIGAYLIGKKFGKRKLVPRISPGKSIEGAIGGLIFVWIYLLILKVLFAVPYLNDYGVVFKFGLIITSVGILGDLFESWLKRIANVKDSGNILPGHGGILDRIDSSVAIIVIAFSMIWSM